MGNRLLAGAALGGLGLLLSGCPQPAPTEGFDLVVTSAAANGNNAALRFSGDTGAALGVFAVGGGLNDPRDILPDPANPNTVLINGGADNTLRFNQTTGTFLGEFISFDGLNAGGGIFGPDGNFYAGARSLAAVLRFDGRTGAFLDEFVPSGSVAFPRGFVFGSNGDFYLGAGSNPATGAGEDTIIRFDGQTGALLDATFVDDPELSPLDVISGPDGALYVSSEFPFNAPDASGTVRVYDVETGALLRVLDPGLDANGAALLQRPRGMGFGPDGLLYVSSTGTGSVLRFEPISGAFVDVFVEFANLNGQALTFVPQQ